MYPLKQLRALRTLGLPTLQVSAHQTSALATAYEHHHAYLESCDLVQHHCLELLVRHVAVAQHFMNLAAQLVHITLPASDNSTADLSAQCRP